MSHILSVLEEQDLGRAALFQPFALSRRSSWCLTMAVERKVSFGKLRVNWNRLIFSDIWKLDQRYGSDVTSNVAVAVAEVFHSCPKGISELIRTSSTCDSLDLVILVRMSILLNHFSPRHDDPGERQD